MQARCTSQHSSVSQSAVATQVPSRRNVPSLDPSLGAGEGGRLPTRDAMKLNNTKYLSLLNSELHNTYTISIFSSFSTPGGEPWEGLGVWLVSDLDQSARRG